MLIKHLLLFLLLTFNTYNMTAQRLVRVNSATSVCAAEGDETPKDRYADKASPQAQKVIEDICRKIGVSPNLFIIEAANVKNAEALVIQGKRYIHYSPLYINKIQKESQTYWSMIFILAHEIGHHVNGDSINTKDLEKRKIEELAADKFAGCALRHLGASLEELEKAVNVLSEKGDASHPERSARLMTAARGWEDCKSEIRGDTNNNSGNIPPKVNADCAQKTTGDVYFKNTTNTRIRVFLCPQPGWHEMNPRVTLEAGETKAIYDLPVGRQLLLFQSLTKDGYGFKDYKNDETRVNPCVDAAQSPIIIR
jgi:hypothetical protein